MKLASGVRLGPYEIVAPIGAGGMGEVYRARDTRLDRTVAIKILPADFAQDARLRIRFEREAKAISALNHPHICALYDVGPDYLVMEHCEGKTLALRLSKGALPLEQVLDFGMQIADALDKAHRQGIIHRDLKPLNIMITKSGVKLLDFGLAKQHVDSSPEESTLRQVTEEGKILGTIQYMAPELFHGKEADARSDIFALGLVLYEMATGKPAFSGESKASLIAAILEHEPEPLKPATPTALDRLIRACLAKDPEERTQAAHDVMLELRSIGAGWTEAAPFSRRRFTPREMALAGVAAIAVAGAIAALVVSRSPRAVAPMTLRRYDILIPKTAPLARSGGPFNAIALSPDGKRMVYASVASQGPNLYLRSMETGEIKPIPGTDGASAPFFSPDGEWVGFTTTEGLKKVAVSGGTPTTICKPGQVRGAAWNSDGNIILGLNSEHLFRVSAGGGSPQSLIRDPDKTFRFPSMLPDGKHVLYTVGVLGGGYENAKIGVLSLESGKSKIVLDGGTYPRYGPNGTLLFYHSNALMAAPFDAKKLAITGPSRMVVDDVAVLGIAGFADYDVASDGTLVYVPRDPLAGQRELVWADRKGAATPISSQLRLYISPALAPDGKRLIVGIGHLGRVDLWLYDFEREVWRRLTTEANNAHAVWSPDGQQIVFSSDRDGAFNLYLMPADGSRAPEALTRGKETWFFARSWSSDGRRISMYEQRRAAINLCVFDLGDRAIHRVASRFSVLVPAFSPDGRWIAFNSDESGVDEIYVSPAGDLARKRSISDGGGVLPRWRRDSRELFYRTEKGVMGVDISGDAEIQIGKPHQVVMGDYVDDFDVAADGRRFVMIRQKNPAAPQVNVIVGAFDSRQVRPAAN